ncbi:MAG: GyrI-like domain-containing protein [Candidatus Marinimicrobia bacterium]|nr:GyrI-like domain-containing protein [Candidatus Neomarinimicrobiota bacterium]
MNKIDFKKDLKHLYQPSPKKVGVVDVPEMNFLMIDGEGDPNNSEQFQNAVEALYGISYTTKFTLKKKGLGPDYVVPPLEGLWWMKNNEEFDMEKKELWLWTLMIAQPEHISREEIENSIVLVKEKKDPPALSEVRFQNFQEGLAVQIMHIGPYAEERPTIQKVHQFADENHYILCGKHHEIYLSDPNRTKPERLKTVIRHPVKQK